MEKTPESTKNNSKVKSPDNLGEYIRVASPGVWLLLTAIIVLLAGALCWGCFGSLRTELKVDAHCEGGEIICHITSAEAELAQVGQSVKIGDINGRITEVCTGSEGSNYCRADMEEPLQDGVYIAVIEIESVHPIYFLIN